MRIATFPVLLALTALAGCNQSKKDEGAGTAAGEILPGSASDAMLPYDTVRSQPPLAPPPSASGKPGAKAEAGEADAAASEAGEETAAAPASAAPATPAPEG